MGQSACASNCSCAKGPEMITRYDPTAEEMAQVEAMDLKPVLAVSPLPSMAVLCPEALEMPSIFTLQLHSAHLTRTFAKVGWMDPYAIITVDDNEVGRTSPDKWAHRNPTWESTYFWKSEGVPGTISVSVWDRNRWHRDVFCGSVTLPCSADMGRLARRDFTLTKRHEATGIVSLTVDVGEMAAPPPCTDDATASLAGMEFDHMASWSCSNGRGPSIHLQEPAAARATPVEGVEGAESGDEADVPVEPPITQPPVAATGMLVPALLGSWKCTATTGLDEFLKATGVSAFQRRLASATKWPRWEYSAQEDLVIFINRSAIGDLKEEFPLGREYRWTDGRGNPMVCTAEWRPTPEGGVLLTSRAGPVGSYREERRVAGGRLDFTLTHKTGASWGRTFQRVV